MKLNKLWTDLSFLVCYNSVLTFTEFNGSKFSKPFIQVIKQNVVLKNILMLLALEMQFSWFEN